MPGVDYKSKFAGCMVGSALGDAIGELAFMHPVKEALCSYLGQARVLRYTDDTAMAIGIAESMARNLDLNQQDLGDTLKDNFNREPWRGYASGPPSIFSLVEQTGASYPEAAKRLFGGTGSFGNGAAMRISPIGLFFHRSDKLREKAAASAEVTHAHPVGIDGASLQAFAVSRAVGLDPSNPFPSSSFLKAAVEFSTTPEIQEKMRLVAKLNEEGVSPDSAADQIGRSVAVHESMPFAIFSFIRHPHSFEECMFCAVLNGGDRDTLGAMACAVSGAYLGIEGVPKKWQQKLENLEYIKGLALDLAEKYERISF